MRMTTASEERCLAVTALRYRKFTARQLISKLVAATRTAVSRQTLYRRFNERGLCVRKPRVCALLFSKKKRDRFNWYREHQNWN